MTRNTTKLSDYLIDFIARQGVKDVFLISGGGNIHIIDSIGRNKKINYICNHHEQACAIAAEGYARITGNLGVCIVTTGPGGTNTITGLVGSWLDSIPVLFISGQVRRDTIGAGKGLRQLGDQEINIVDIVKPVTKYAVTVMDSTKIRYHLEKAVYLAKSGRPGPVWVDIPLDVQGLSVNVSKLEKFSPKELKPSYKNDKKELKKIVSRVIDKIKASKRPILLVGNGVRLAGASKEILELIRLFGIPVLTSFGGYDLVSDRNINFRGRPGTVGQRAGNFVLQNSDLLLVLGSRLHIRTIGYNFESFAKGAYKILVDIDKREMKKKSVKGDLTINYDVKDFIKEVLVQLAERPLNLRIDDWIKKTRDWNLKYFTVPDLNNNKNYVNTYVFVDRLSKHLESRDILVLANGSACVCTYQALKFPQGLRIVVNSGCASMGYALPAAIGACFANRKKKTICIEGDGSMQLNIQELQTIVHHNLPIKIFIYNNGGYLSIRMTQKNLFEKRFFASGPKKDLTCPNFLKIGRAYGIKVERIVNNEELDRKIKKVLSYPGPIICEVVMDPDGEFVPKVLSRKLPDESFVSGTLEDMYPFLDREELKENLVGESWKKDLIT